MKLILLGAPGSGKGTLAQGLVDYFKIPSISTGDLLRQSIAERTEAGIIAETFINDGKLVPTEIVLNMLVERLQQPDTENGYILDGFPRTLEQAEKLEKLAKVDKCLFLDVEKDVIVKRIGGRRTCRTCGRIYNTSWYKENVCECGGELYTRDDDNPETVAKRFDTFSKQTEPLVEYYENKGILLTIKAGGDATPEGTLKLALEKLK